MAFEVPADFALVKEETFSLTASNTVGHWAMTPIRVKEGVPMIIEVKVLQTPGRVDDIDVYLLDESNYENYAVNKKSSTSRDYSVDRPWSFMRKDRIVQRQLFEWIRKPGNYYLT